MKNINPYPSYKPSGIAWLGEVPNNWKISKIKWLTPVKRGASPRPIDNPIYFDENGEFSWVRIVDVSASGRYLKKTKEKLSELGASLSVKQYPNDLFLSIAGTVGKPIITKINCCIHDGFVYFPNLKINSEYLYYIFITGLAYQGLGKMGTQLNLNTETVGSISIPIPEDNEIEKIISFLDYKLHKIDRFIRKKKQLIALLNEQKAAIINDAVTKGLDPSVKMKKSGVEWLGNIPNHWKMIRTKHVFKLITDVAPPNNSEVLLSIYTQYGVKPRTEFEERGNRATTTDNYWIVKKQDIIVNKLLAWMGAIGISEYDGVTSPAYDILRSKGEADPYFYHYLFRIPIMFNEFKRHSRGIMDVRLRLYFSEFGDIKLPVPPLLEQKAIVTHIEKETAILNRTIATIEKEITLVQEYRTTLIAEAVTGKIDVRNYLIDNGELIMDNEEEEGEMGLDTEGGEEE